MQTTQDQTEQALTDQMQTTKSQFNHDANDVQSATGVNMESMNERLNQLPDEAKKSETVEFLSNNFTTVELAVLFVQASERADIIENLFIDGE